MILYDKITKTFDSTQVSLRHDLSVGTRPNAQTEIVVSIVGNYHNFWIYRFVCLRFKFFD